MMTTLAFNELRLETPWSRKEKFNFVQSYSNVVHRYDFTTTGKEGDDTLLN